MKPKQFFQQNLFFFPIIQNPTLSRSKKLHNAGIDRHYFYA